MTDQHGTGDDQEERPGFTKLTGQTVTAAAALIGLAGAIIAFVLAGRLLFRFGLFLIIAGAAVAIGVAGFQIIRSGRLRGLFQRWGLNVAAIGACLLIAGGVVIMTLDKSGSTAPCNDRAQVSGADTNQKNITASVYLRCLAPSNKSLRLVVQDLDEGVKGTQKHSEYYLAWDVSNSLGRQSFNDSPGGCVTRKYYVIAVDQEGLDSIQGSSKTSGGAYYGEPVDTLIGQYIWSNVQINHSCNNP